MKYYIKAFLALAICAFLSSFDTDARKSDKVIWQIGDKDGTPKGFVLYPDGFKDFIEHDFGYEDKFFLIGWSDPAEDFPYVLPGPADTWGGTWSTAGWRTHCVNVLFNLRRKPVDKGEYILRIHLADHATKFLPLVKISLNERDHKVQLTKEGIDLSSLPAPGQTEPVTDTLGITGDLSEASPCTIEMPLSASDLRKGPNILTISVLDGSWILFDQVELLGPSRIRTGHPRGVFVRDVKAAPYQLGDSIQPLLVDIEHLEGTPSLEIKVDGSSIMKKDVEQGRYILEAGMVSVKEATKSHYTVLANGRRIASGTVIRSPQPIQTPAGYVDTRTGTAHSRWMIAPGPWMPFSMVKMSPDNQNSGWQAGYQPSFESIGCFSHIHEWTMGGLGIMAANGPLKTAVGDQRKDDEGYRSRIDKRSEKAGIGYYSARLTDYDILAEVTATTRCGFERFTFPSNRGEGRILVDFRPPAEYGILIKDASVTKVSDTRLEGYCHEFSPNVWSRDADQDYRLHFVIEFDRPVKNLGCWSDGRIVEDVSEFKWGECDAAGMFAVFDPGEDASVQVRTGISLVSVANAAENLEKEVITPFGWDFEAVMDNNVATWNDIFARVEIESDDAIEKAKFYNNMYRAVCSRNTWSDVNGEWISTDGVVRRVENPEDDVMLGCDAFWNTFWNLNQFWNLVTPEWSRRWVRSQLAMYEANGRLAKGPAGLNYIPVMVAEHEIPLMVSAWQMGIRGFDPEKVLEAAVKMQTTSARKVFKGFAGNRDLVPYMKYHYVPYDKGRFSNSMEYSFDDWTVGQLAKSLGKEDVYNTFNDRGYWWKNVIDDDGYCHMKDSDGNWMEGFDPFRSGANRQYVEGNAWQLTFFVPQDVPALVEMIGRKRFTDRLLWGFNQDEAWRYNAPNDQYWDHPVVQGNQQSMHFAFLFNYAGQPWNTQRWSRSILDRYYGSGVANAYLGDEDQGQMSAWAVMASLGLFQMDGGCNSVPAYEIASPIFKETVIHLDGREGRGDKFVIKANGASRKNIYVQSARLNGKEWDSFKFPASELLGGGILELEMGPEPNEEWGLQKEVLASIGQVDGSGNEFALAPDKQNEYVSSGFADASHYFYLKDEDASDFPFVIPGPFAPFAGASHWGGPTLIRSKMVVSLKGVRKDGSFNLDLHLTDVDWEPWMRMRLGIGDFEQWRDVGQEDRALTFTIPPGVLKDGANVLELRIYDGKSVSLDAITLSGDPRTEVVNTGSDPIVDLEPCPYLVELPGGKTSPAVLVHAISRNTGTVKVVVDGVASDHDLRMGENRLEIPCPKSSGKADVSVEWEGRHLASGNFRLDGKRVRKSIDYVDQMMGSSGSRWMIGPGPWMPFGMVKIMPDNEDSHWKNGYEDNVDNIMGFSHIHEWTMAGLLTMPANGPLKLQSGTEKDPDSGYRSRFDKKTETSRIGYYGVELEDYGILAELTATTRASFQRYTFHRTDDPRILVDFLFPGEYPWTVENVKVRKVSDHRIEGSIPSRSWGSGYHGNQTYTLHFVMESDRPIAAMNAWNGNDRIQDVEYADNLSEDCGIWLDFDLKDGDNVQIRTGISLVSVENAGENLREEITKPFGWSFEAVETAQREEWQTLFDRIKVYTPDALLKKKFYTNLYRSISPRTIWNDVNGQWIDMNGNVAVVEKGKQVYGGDSLWGTHWDLGPFYNILYPEFMSNWLYTFEQTYSRGGWLPVGNPGMKYFRVMVGAPAIPFIASAWQHGIRDFDTGLLAEAIAHQQTAPKVEWPDGTQLGNESYPDYIDLGYVPLYTDGKGFDGPHYQSYVSNTMEYSFQDWCAASFLRHNGYEDLADTLFRRSSSWKNLFDPSTGFIRPRLQDGSFIKDFDPYKAPGFCEGSSWQFTWYVPHDMESLIGMMGERAFIDKLEWGMSESAKRNFNATGDDFSKAAINHGNQTNMQSAYLFNFTSEPYRTNKWAREIQERYYGIEERDAYPGDEDQGQMSSWYVLSSLGFFEMDGGCSDNPLLSVGSPAFEEVEITLSPKYYDGKKLILKAPGTSPERCYVKSITLDGNDIGPRFIPWSRLKQGGVVSFKMSNQSQ